MDLIHSTGMTPQQIDGLREVFTQHDDKRKLALPLATIKRVFDQTPNQSGFSFDRQQMVTLTDALKETESRVARIRLNSKKPGCGQSMCTDFGEFCVLIHILVAHKHTQLPGIREAFEGIVKRSGLEKWMEKRMA